MASAAPKTSLLGRNLNLPDDQFDQQPLPGRALPLSNGRRDEDGHCAASGLPRRHRARRTCSGRSITKWISCSITKRRHHEQLNKIDSIASSAAIRISHQPFFNRPHGTRRQFFQLLGAGVTGSMLWRPKASAAADIISAPVTTQNKAKNVIFILLTGAPSHTDTFDFKMSPDTPASLQPDTINGVTWPTGLLPKMAASSPTSPSCARCGPGRWCIRCRRPGRRSAAIRRRRWAISRRISAAWWRSKRTGSAGRPGVPDLPRAERAPTRRARATSPPSTRPFKLTPNVNNPAPGFPNTTNAAGPAGSTTRWELLHRLDDPLRVNSPAGNAGVRLRAISTNRPRG